MQSKKLPDKLGGEVRLYNLQKTTLPDVVNTPKEKEAAEWQWWVVHFPSRRCAPVKGEREEALRVMVQYARGVDELALVPEKKLKPVQARARARAEEAGKGLGGGKPPANKMGFTPVPEGLDFDRAMAHVFPVEKITQHFERLLHASEPVYDKEGREVGEREAFTVQFQTLKALTEWHIGRPREKEKKVESKPGLTIADMRKKMLASPEYRAAVLEMVTDCEKEAQRMAGGIKQSELPAK